MKKRKKRMNQNGIAMLSITFVVGVLFIAMMTMSLNLQQQILDCKTEMKEVQSQIDEENERTKEIDETKERMDTDEYVAEVAREKLGLVKDNEIVFKEEEK
ncbi:MAG: FtsB family cell division protein [Blautia hansenii]